MTNLSTVIFSKDRAMQLDALLQSIYFNACEVFNNVAVIYTSSNESFEKANQIVIDTYPSVKFIKETNFKEDTLNVINSSKEYISFMVDDDIIFRPINGDLIEKLSTDSKVCCVSYRLGLNVNHCYTVNHPNVLKDFIEEDSDCISWQWNNQALDFAYPLSLDCHVFRKKDFKKWVEDINFSNPNTLEENIQIKKSLLQEKIVSPGHSAVVGVPINRVGPWPSRMSSQYYHSQEELCEMFLNKKIVDLNSMDFNFISSAHQEVEYKFTNIV